MIKLLKLGIVIAAILGWILGWTFSTPMGFKLVKDIDLLRLINIVTLIVIAYYFHYYLDKEKTAIKLEKDYLLTEVEQLKSACVVLNKIINRKKIEHLLITKQFKSLNIFLARVVDLAEIANIDIDIKIHEKEIIGEIRYLKMLCTSDSTKNRKGEIIDHGTNPYIVRNSIISYSPTRLKFVIQSLQDLNKYIFKLIVSINRS